MGATAIVGLACRFPGGARDAASFAELLGSGRDAFAVAPPRAGLDGLFDPAGGPGRAYTRTGAWLDDDLESFDADFFGISPREALALDPQHRLLLAVVWEALEDAGIAPETLRGTDTGVFVAIGGSDFRSLAQRAGPAAAGPWMGTGTMPAAACGRISWWLDLRGPCASVDTACSSSLVALDQARAAIADGRCAIAVVAGVNLLLDPDATVCLCQMGALSPAGRLRPFDARADGYVRGEGAAALVLASGKTRRVHGWIHGTAVGHGGRTGSLTAPSAAGEADVLARALAAAGVAPADVALVEAHGSGTVAGDAAELRALAEVFGGATVAIQSCKAVIGHLEPVAGLAGILSALLALRARAPWPNPGNAQASGALPAGPALVASFGMGGTNAAAVVSAERAPIAQDPPAWRVLPLSGRTPEAVGALAAGWAARVERAGWAGAARTAGGRARFPDARAAVVARTAAEARDALAAVVPTISGRPRIGFAYAGQVGAGPWDHAAVDAAEPAFRAALDAAAAVLDPELGDPLREILWGAAAGRLADTAVAQPAGVALALAWTALWADRGVVPDVVAGHSLGALAAAAAAGAADPAEILRFAVARGRALAGATGGMVAVLGPRADAEALARRLGLEVAARNHAEELVLTGPSVDAAVGAPGLVICQISAYAFHSAAVDVAAVDAAAAAVPWRAPRIPWAGAPAGWGAHAREPVDWEGAVRAAAADVWVEIGPKPALGGSLRAAVAIPPATSPESFARALAAAWTAGADVRWPADGPLVDGPHYPFAAQIFPLPGAVRATPPTPRRAVVTHAVSLTPGSARPVAPGDLHVLPPGDAEARARWALGVVRAAAADGRRPWILADGVAGPAGGADVDAAAALGVIRVARRELPHVSPVWLDLDPAAPPAERTRAIAEALAQGSPLPELILRGGRWLVPGLDPLPATPPLDPRGTSWVILGGYGALGARLAAWLLASGASVAVIGRRPGEAPAGALALVADCADPAALAAALDRVGRVDRVVHCAGWLADGTIEAGADAALGDVLRAKVGVALALSPWLAANPAVGVVVYGSATAVYGTPGQAAYASANAWLDAWAWSLGGRAVALDWGPWAGGGMAAATLDRRRAEGVVPLEPNAALGAFAAAVRAGHPQQVILELERSEPPPLASDLPGIVRRVLGLPAGRPLPPDRPLTELGLDSILAVELRNALLAAGRDIPLGDLLGGATLAELGGPPPSPPSADPPDRFALGVALGAGVALAAWAVAALLG